ncbi:MAG: hypothetical protein FD134_490 [Gallionellaceae bacterium]|nr:MAG: hypothetical protein FD134_490 [Gallionellaceae bacterium]
MNTFDSAFFNELAKLDALVKLNEYDSILMPPSDGFRLRVSELHAAGRISDAFAGLARDFVAMLAERSNGRYRFEKDFRVFPHRVYSYSQGRSGRKQLHVGFDAYPPSVIFPHPWGVSIGLGFDFRNAHGIITECVDEYEAFYEKVFVEPELFDATFGSLGGYAEPTGAFKGAVTAEKVWQTEVNILQNWLFFGRRLTPDDIAAFGTLEGFVDECIQVFDAICEAGYFLIER